MFKNNHLKVLALVISLVLILGSVPVISFAAQSGAAHSSISTLATADEILSLEVDFKIENGEDGRYKQHLFSAKASGGVEPYTYVFRFGNTIYDDISSSDEVGIYIPENGQHIVKVFVVDSIGNTGVSYTQVVVNVHNKEEVSTADEIVTHEIYFQNEDNWQRVYAYAWSTGEDGVVHHLGQWPGTICTDVGNGMNLVYLPDDAEYIVFSDDSGCVTNELVNPGTYNIAMYESNDGEDYTYNWFYPIVTDPTEPTEETEPLEKEPVKVYFKNSEAYEEVYAYVWDDEGNVAFGQWPGTPCKDEGNGYWSAMIPADCTYVIFNNGDNGKQTNNLINPRCSMTADLAENVEHAVYEWFDYIPAADATESTTVEPTEATFATENTDVTEVTSATEAADKATNDETTAPAEMVTTEISDGTQSNVPEAPIATDAPSTKVPELTDSKTEPEIEGTTTAEPKFETGDVNKDSELNIKDVTAIQKFIAKLLDFSDEVLVLADFNKDSEVNIKDATTIQKKLANLI